METKSVITGGGTEGDDTVNLKLNQKLLKNHQIDDTSIELVKNKETETNGVTSNNSAMTTTTTATMNTNTNTNSTETTTSSTTIDESNNNNKYLISLCNDVQSIDPSSQSYLQLQFNTSLDDSAMTLCSAMYDIPLPSPPIKNPKPKEPIKPPDDDNDEETNDDDDGKGDVEIEQDVEELNRLYEKCPQVFENWLKCRADQEAIERIHAITEKSTFESSSSSLKSTTTKKQPTVDIFSRWLASPPVKVNIILFFPYKYTLFVSLV